MLLYALSACSTPNTATSPTTTASAPDPSHTPSEPNTPSDKTSETAVDDIDDDERFEIGVAAFDAHDGRTAFEALLPLAEKGDARAQELIGRLFYRGKDKIPRDCELAQRWFQAAAEQHYPPAQNALGLLHHTGCGLPFDLNKAAEWYGLSADNGFAPAQFNLAHLYTLGTGIERNLELALYWYGKAAEQGYALAVTEKKRLERRLQRGNAAP